MTQPVRTKITSDAAQAFMPGIFPRDPGALMRRLDRMIDTAEKLTTAAPHDECLITPVTAEAMAGTTELVEALLDVITIES